MRYEHTPYPQHLAAEHRLADGFGLRIRPISPLDRRRHWRFLCSLSLQTRYQRLLSARGLLPGELQRMVEIDYLREMALVAVADFDGEERELGVARYVREDADDPGAALATAAEFAIVVADAWQRRGIGALLLHRLRQVAEDAGIRQLAGLTLATNTRMIKLARRMGFEISREPDDWTVKRLTWRQPLDDNGMARPVLGEVRDRSREEPISAQ
jgi:GNAT superfamily N-acetyltransferase